MLFALIPGGTDMLIIGVVAVMLFGKNLPQVARQAGKALSELKKGMAGLQSELNSAIYNDNTSNSNWRQSSYSSYRDDDESDEPTAPKFVPPPAASSLGAPPSMAPRDEQPPSAG